MTIHRTKYRAHCTQCDNVQDFHLETNRKNWVYAHERLRNHTEVELSEVTADLSREEYDRLMQP